MIITYIRSSSYNNYDYCQMQYFITYVLGWKSDSGAKADKGTMAHKVMEALAGLKKFQQDFPRKVYLEIEDDMLGKIKINSANLNKDTLVENLVDASFNAYKAESKNKFTEADKKDVLKTVFTFLRHKGGVFDPRNRNIFYQEAHFDIPIEEDWAKYEYVINGEKVSGQLAIKGTIDLTTKVNEDTLEVIDWKTGRRMDWATGEEKDEKKLKEDAQLLLYHYAISKLYPQFKYSIMSIFFYKNKDGEIDPMPFSLCFDENDKTRFLDKLKSRFLEIQKNNDPQTIDPKRSTWKCKSLCHFCKNKWPESNKSMCIYIEDHIKNHGLQKTVEECTKPGFNIGFYTAPG